MELTYKTVREMAQAEIIEKKSRFISTVFHIENEEEAIQIINTVNRKNWDATHNCYAYVLGNKNEIQRYNDDGEPSGTAGMPILEVIRGTHVRDILVIVTRYFGGTLLGTGGLVRAYTDSTKAVLEIANIEENVWCSTYEIITDYVLVGKIQYLLSEEKLITLDIDYTDIVTLQIAIEKIREEEIITKLTELTSAKIKIRKLVEKFIKKTF